KGFEVKVDSSLDFKTATSWRDFTINAIGYDIETKEILDPFNGREDLEKRILRAVDINKFQDDPLRVLRAIQFSSRFNLSIDDELFITCQNMIKDSLLDELPKERIFIEFQKLLLKSSTPSSGLKLLNSLGGFNYFTEFKNLNPHELEKTYRAVNIMSSLKTANNKTNTMLMLAALCYLLSVESFETFLSKLSDDKQLFNRVSSLLKHQNDINFELFNDYEIYILATKVNIEEFVSLSIARSQTKITLEYINNLKTRAEELGVLHEKAKAIIQGKDILKLGIEPSKEFSKILDSAYEAQARGDFRTKEEAVVWLKKSFTS
ncbi:MAG: CCA tRNA nucleotidyltransferase, partial [Campylobacterota bacterium]